MNKMEQLFQEQRRNLVSMMMYAKQGLPPTIHKDKIESMKQPLKEQNNTSKHPKRNNPDSMRKRNSDKKKKQKSSHTEDVNF